MKPHEAALAKLSTMNETYRQYGRIMTDYEKATHRQAFAATRDQYRQIIEGGLIADHSAAIENYKAKIARVEEERRKITNDWDASKLSAEMQVAQMQIEIAAKIGDVAGLQALFQEAQTSGDKYKARAFAETIRGAKVSGDVQDIHGESGARALNNLQQQAGRQLTALQTSPGLEDAHKEAAESVDILDAVTKNIYRAAEVMGETYLNGGLANRNFSKEVARVHQDGSGNFLISDEVKPIPPQPVRQMTETEKSFYQIKE